MQNYGFFIYALLIILAEVWLVYYIYRDTSKIFFLAVSPLRWLSIIILITKYQNLGWGFIVLLLLLAAFYWLLNNFLINILVLNQPVMFVGQDGAIGKFMHKVFPKNTGLLTTVFKLLLFGVLLYLYHKFFTGNGP